MKPISVQLYSVRQLAAEDFFGTLKKVADIGYKGVELAGLYDFKPAEVKKVISDLGMTISSAHAFPNRPEEFEPAVEQAKEMGYDLIVVPWAPKEHFQSVEAVKKLGETMGRLLAKPVVPV